MRRMSNVAGGGGERDDGGCGLETLALGLWDAVPFVVGVAEDEVLPEDDLEDLELLETLDDDLEATVETTRELLDDLLCSLWDSWSKALMACNLDELDSDINDW